MRTLINNIMYEVLKLHTTCYPHVSQEVSAARARLRRFALNPEKGSESTAPAIAYQFSQGNGSIDPEARCTIEDVCTRLEEIRASGERLSQCDRIVMDRLKACIELAGGA